MSKFLAYENQKFANFLFYIACISLIVFISACGDADYSSSGSGSIAFSIEWRDAPTIKNTEASIIARNLSCGDVGVETIEADVYDESGSFLVSGDPWLCSAHQGTVYNIPVGSNRKFIVLGKDINENVIYQGEKTGITISAGQETNVGTVVVEPTSAPSAPTNVTATAGNGQVTIGWGTVANATLYNIYWSTSSGVKIVTGTKISNVTSPYTHTGRTNGTTYYYVVTAVNSYGESGVSIEVSATPTAAGEAVTWEIKTSTMPTARSSPKAAVSGTDIFTLGGHGGSGTYSSYSGMRENEVYHSSTDSWEQMASIPYNRGCYEFATAVINNKIFMFGGADPPGHGHYPYINMYDISSNTWTADVATLPYPACSPTAVAYNGFIYVFGGKSGAESGSGQPFRKIAIKFDPNTYTYTNLSELPHFRGGGGAFVLDNLIYIVGGTTATQASSPYGTTDNTPVIDVYDPSANSWTTKGEVPISGVPVLVNGTIFLISNDLNTSYKYNALNDTWNSVESTFNNTISLSGVGCFGAVGNKIYALGGSQGGNTRLDTVIEGTINPSAIDVPSATTGVATSVTSNSATLNGTVNPNGDSTTYYFEYGTTVSYGSTTTSASAGSGRTDVSVNADVSSLTPNATYHFRVVATNSVGTTYGADQSFTTIDAPSATTEPATLVTSNSATLNGTVNPNGDSTTYYFEYGTTTSYGTTTTSMSAGSGTTDVSVNADISSLSSNTSYHYRIVATNSAGTTYGSDKSFTTINEPPTTTITSPADGSTFNESNTITLEGTGSDHEDGALTGTSLVWTSSIDGEIGTGASFVKNNLSVGAHTITLAATDSNGATGTDSVNITINASPTASITSPLNNSTYNEGETITFSGTGSDPEDGALTGTSLVWSSSINDQIGTGTTFSTTSLSAGIHTIIFIATDSSGGTGTDSVNIWVQYPWTMLNLPDTGQTTSYTTTQGEDSDYTINPPSYTDNSDGTVTDNVTSLMWQKEDDNTTRIWEAAISYCEDNFRAPDPA